MLFIGTGHAQSKNLLISCKFKFGGNRNFQSNVVKSFIIFTIFCVISWIKVWDKDAVSNIHKYSIVQI